MDMNLAKHFGFWKPSGCHHVHIRLQMSRHVEIDFDTVRVDSADQILSA